VLVRVVRSQVWLRAALMGSGDPAGDGNGLGLGWAVAVLLCPATY